MKTLSTLIVSTLCVFTFFSCDHKKTTSAGTGEIPVVTTIPITAITATGAISGGNISSQGNSDITAKGVCWSTSPDPDISGPKTADGTGMAQFTSPVSGLTPGTLYYLKAYATNATGTGYGSQVTFTTLAITPNPNPTVLPSVTTSAATYNAGSNSIATGGNVTADGGAPVTGRGVVWATTQNPTTANNKTSEGTGTGVFISTIAGLVSNTTYYIRAYATNSVGTQYGTQVTVTTPGGGSTSPYTIGQSFGGGIIFFIDASGQHGLIAATQDQGSARWDYRSNSTLIGANSVTDGKINTDKIILALGTSQSHAALICRNYNAGGFTDWFLPSRNQLDQLFQQRTVVGGFTTGKYWGSTEDDADKAWMQEFGGSNAGRQDDENKDNSLRVRPVRAF